MITGPALCCTPTPATENRKVGGSIPSLPTTSARVRPPVASAPLGVLTPGSAIAPARPPQDPAGAGIGGDPRGQVHGTAEVVAALDHHRPGRHPHVRRRHHRT